MDLNRTYYQLIWNKYKDIHTLSNEFIDNSVCLTVKIILDHYKKNLPIQINFQNSKDLISGIVRHLFVELANDIYLNHYDLPDSFCVGDKLKRIVDNQYYEITHAENGNYSLRQVLRKTKVNISPATIPSTNYDRLTKGYVKVNTGVSERTIKNYFAFFKKLNNEKSDFPRIKFEQKSVFISKKPLWDSLKEKSKIPSVYLPNPREEDHLTETRSIPALSDCLIYFTPKYEVCYHNLLSKGEKIKTIVVFDTEADKMQQILQDKVRFGFNLIVLSDSYLPLKSPSIPCWNWFKEELKIVNDL